MSTSRDDVSQLTRALAALQQMRARLDTVEKARTEPIAVVGMSCRFPGGANSPSAFWRLLAEGRDAVSETPPDRWNGDALFDADPDAPGRLATRWGGFVDRIDGFDPAFFGISPREAAQMDPQQRLLLETSWEALENAGEPADRLAGSATGVWVGVHSHSSDYALLQMRGLEDLGTYTSTGTAHSIVANRLSYLLDLRGPSLAIDTACSSSLVAVHLAVQSLRGRECDRALAGGVNLLLTPEITAALSRMRMMAADGRCKSFDARADGFVRGEGCGVVVLKRLSDAVAGGDPILAVIAGSAVNQDGTTNGLTAPNGLSQQEVVRRALRDAQVDPARIGFVETHGTGTALGDPIEVEALAEVLGRAGDAPCLLGAVKSNIGHLEGAAGIAGLIKVVLALQHESVPPNLHFQELNPHISLAGTRLGLPAVTQPWPAGTDRHAGVSSFGFGGTNAHVVLREAPAGAPAASAETTTRPPQRAHLLPVSARTPQALRTLASAFADLLGGSPPPLADVCYTAAVRRTHHPFRIAVVAGSAAEMRNTLLAAAADEERPEVARGHADPDARRRLVWLFSGQGSQWSGMGAALLDEEPVFRAALEECDRHLHPLAGWSVIDEIAAPSGRSRLDRTEFTQPSIFAVQVALAALWWSWGIVPDAVIGHSVGEVAAAHVVGALTLEDAVRVIHHRGRVMQPAAGAGKMAAVGLPRAAVEDFLRGLGGPVSLAGVNGPGTCVISGEPAAVEHAVGMLAERGVFTRMLAVNLASHSAQMEPMRDELVRSLAGLAAGPATIPIFSTVTGMLAGPEAFGAEYWGRNLREPVLFADAVAAALDAGLDDFLEISPHPILRTPVEQCAGDREALIAGSLIRDEPDRAVLLRSLGALHTRGYPVNWSALFPTPGRVVPLPNHPWQRSRFWIEPRRNQRSGNDPDRLPSVAAGLEIPGRRLDSPAIRASVYESRMSAAALGFLGDHRIGGEAVAPAAIFVEHLLAAGRDLSDSAPGVVQNLAIVHPLVLPEHGGRIVHAILQPPVDGAAAWELHSRSADADGGWLLHATGTVVVDAPKWIGGETVDLSPLPALRAPEDAGPDAGELAGETGLVVVDSVRRTETETVAQLRFREGEASDAKRRAAVLDACFRLAGGMVAEGEGYGVFVVANLGELRQFRPVADELRCRIRKARSSNGPGHVADLDIHDPDDSPVLAVRELGFARIERPDARTESWHHEVVWRPRSILSQPAASAVAAVPCPDRLVASCGAEPVPAEPERSDPGSLAAALDQASSALVVAALRSLGVPLHAGSAFSTEQIAERAGVAPWHRRLLTRMLGMLEEDGVLAGSADGWTIVGAADACDAERLLDDLAVRHPGHAAELAVFRRCGRALADVLRGHAEPLQLLFPDGEAGETERLYHDAPLSLGPNLLVRDIVTEAMTGLSSNRTIRILEIGGGTGGTTAHLLPRLPAERTEYVFSEVSPTLLDGARARFRRDRCIRFEVLDIERDAGAQGFAPGGFDVVVAANVLHATADVAAAVRRARGLLAPGGLLVLLEGVRPARWIDLSFGLTEGWWKFADTDLRPSHPLLDANTWISLLRSHRFADAAALRPGTPSRDMTFEQAVILATADGSPAASDNDADGSAAVADARWLILGGTTDVAGRLAETIRAASGSCTVAEGEDEVGPWCSAGAGAGHVVDLRGLEPAAEHGVADPFESVRARCASLASVARAIADAAGTTRLWITTRGAEPVGSDEAPDPAQAALWGFGRSLALESPGGWGGLVDLDPAADPSRSARDLLAQISAGAGEDQAAFRGGQRWVPRLAGLDPAPAAAATSDLRADASYLITGGLGDLGLALARWLAQRGARHLVLTGRAGLPARGEWASLEPGSRASRQAEAVLAIEGFGAAVLPIAADVTDAVQTETLIARFGEEFPPLRGVFLLAATMEFDPLPRLDAERIGAVLRPKVAGACHLDRLTRSLPLDHWVLFSSAAALWGSRGMAHYAAANAFLDALAHRRRALGLPALSVNWGGWAGGDETRETNRFLRGSDFRLMPADAALDALGAAMAAGVAQRTIAWVDWDSLRSSYEFGTGRPFLQELGSSDDGPAVPDSRDPADPSPALLQQLRAQADDEARATLTSFVRGEVAAVLGLEPARLMEPNQGFFKLGMDSLMTVDLRGRLERAMGLKLPTTIAFEYPTVETLSGFLADRLRVMDADAPARAPEVEDVPAVDDALDRAGPALETLSETDLATMLDSAIADLLDDEATAR